VPVIVSGCGSVRGERKLTRDREFQLVYAGGKSWSTREIAIRIMPNGLDFTRYGFAVGKRVGKAVVRNKVKRRLREILRLLPLSGGWDIVVIARAPAAQADYKALNGTIKSLLIKAGVVSGEYESVRPGVD
jgi:ribonuclease P protein component